MDREIVELRSRDVGCGRTRPVTNCDRTAAVAAFQTLPQVRCSGSRDSSRVLKPEGNRAGADRCKREEVRTRLVSPPEMAFDAAGQ